MNSQLFEMANAQEVLSLREHIQKIREELLAIHNPTMKNIIPLENDFGKERVHDDVRIVATKKAEELKKERSELMRKIESVVLNMISDIRDGEPVRLSFPHGSQDEKNPDDEKVLSLHEVKMSSRASQPKLALMVQLLSKVHEFLSSGTSATKRELFYQFLLPEQAMLDSAVVCVSNLLDAAPWELGIFSTAKGIVAGDLTIYFSGGVEVSCKKGVLIPSNIHLAVKLKSPAQFALIVEKDAIFHNLREGKLLDHLQPFILITGKGYPDLPTRQLVKMVWDVLKIPIFILVDADPHGIDIMCTYRFGSLKMSRFSSQLIVPSIMWIGVHPSDIARFNFHKNALLPFSERDFALGAGLLERPYLRKNEKLKKEIEVMMELKNKAEIEALESLTPNFLTNLYLSSKIVNRQYI